jgi:UDP-glucose 4-epimerase
MHSKHNRGTILVVGGAGYIGSHMVRALGQAGYEAIVFDNLSTGSRDLLQGGPFIEGELGDADQLDRLFSEHVIDAVMHFAAFSLVGESVLDPMKYYRNNVAATTVLIEAMLRHGIRHFIFSSTAAVYGEPQYCPIDEIHPCAPTNPYGATKLAVERMLHDCARAHDFSYVSLRYFNAAGADPSASIGEMHDPESHLIPLLLKVAAGEMPEIKLFGNDYDTEDGTCIRDYIHVNDLAAAHLLALQKIMQDSQSDTYNLGNSKGYSVLQVLDVARKVTGRNIPSRTEERRAGDPAVLVAESNKIRDELGWKPQFEHLEAIVESAWNWHNNSHPG